MNALRRIVSLLLQVAERVWRRDWAFLCVVTAMNLFLSRRTWHAGIWADNDSVCHYAYLRHLLDDFYPATGTFMGFTPKFNVGLPYLLYNTPPGLYVVTALLAKGTGLSALVALKIVVELAFLSVPLLGYALARTFEETRTDFPKMAALSLSLFSSELFGLEFYFKNGMLNPALALPMLLATLVAYRHAQLAVGRASLRWIALGAVLFAATIFTHVLSAYMLCVALLGFAVGRGWRSFGASVLKVGALVATGGLLACGWLVPSLPFAAQHDAAYTWSRPWESTLSDFADGSLISSYPVGFDPLFITRSNVGILATILGVVAIVFLVRRFNDGIASCLAAFAISFEIALGPNIHFGVSLLPVYEKLLWYRFITLALAMWLIVAAYGASKIAELRGRYYPLNIVGLCVAAGAAFFVMTTRAVRIDTAAVRTQFVESTATIADWLREHGDRRGRVFSEFLNTNAVAAVSVNYPRHMIPILSGFDEACGWIYENNPVSQALMKKGPFWFDAAPMIDDAERYDVKYIVAGSPQFARALSDDPRWKLVRSTPDLELFERVGFEPSIASGDGLTAAADGRFVRGGGYAYEIAVTQANPSAPTTMLVKTNYSFAWRATVDGEPVALRSAPDGLIMVDLPPSANRNRRVSLVWNIDDLRQRGRRGTLVGVLVVALLIVIGRLRRLHVAIPPRVVQVTGSASAFVVFIGMLVRAHPVDADIGGYGVANGISPVRTLANVDVGAYYDAQDTQPNHLLAPAWSERAASANGLTQRTLLSDAPAAVLTLGQHNTLTLRGAGDARDVEIVLSRDADVACSLTVSLGEATELPAACAAGDDSHTMGHRRTLSIRAPRNLTLNAIEVASDIRYVEAESLYNTVYDGGCDAFYTMGASIDYYATNGVMMTAAPPYNCPIDLLGRLDAPRGKYDVWILTRAIHPRFRMTRGDVAVAVGDKVAGTFDGVIADTFSFWDHEGKMMWIRLGSVSIDDRTDLELRFRRKLNAIASGSDVDALAFVPQ